MTRLELMSERIKSLRTQFQMTQEELAPRLRRFPDMKTSRETIVRWEAGGVDPGVYSINCLSEVFGVPVGYITGKSENAIAIIASDHQAERRILIQEIQKADSESLEKLFKMWELVRPRK